MAEKRMFAKTIIDSDAFLEMPTTSQLLYFHLSMRADDDGFINKPKAIMKMVGANDDDLKILFMKKFVIPFESGVVVIKHWRINNYIRSDTYHKTPYQDEMKQLELDENNAYTLRNRHELTTQNRLDKTRLDKNRLDSSARFTKPSIEDVQSYINEKQLKVDAQRFIDYYESNGWMVGRNHMKDWKATIRRWNNKPSKTLPKYMSEQHKTVPLTEEEQRKFEDMLNE